MGYQSMDISWCKNGCVHFKLYTGKSINTFLCIVQFMLLGKEKDGSAKKGLNHQAVMETSMIVVSSLSNNGYRGIHW